MVENSEKQNVISCIENRIQALERIKLELQRLFDKWEARKDLSDKSAKQIIDFWQFKIQIGLPIQALIAEKRKLARYIPKQTIEDIDTQLEELLPVFISPINGEFAISEVLNRCLTEVDDLIVGLKRISTTLKQQKKPTRRIAWKTAKKYLKIGLGASLIGLDAPTVNFVSIIPGACIILSATEPPR